jgi:carbamoyl-phosphate synthase small subunit
MTGYQEVVTDPSFYGQLVCMTYPLIGNYGVCDEDEQSRRPWAAGLIVREYCDRPSHWKASETLASYLERWGIPGLAHVDTRALTRHLRTHGTMRAILVPDRTGLTDAELVAWAQQAWTPDREDVVPAVRGKPATFGPADAPHIVLIDCGVKRNIIASLLRRAVRLTVLPYGVDAATVLALEPDGIVVSPGPGDPTRATDAIETVRVLATSGIPFFGICLGHQLLALAAGARTIKLTFGHRGGNHPVKEIPTGRVRITSQNHGYCVARDSIPEQDGWQVWMINVNDGTVEGLRHRSLPVLTVQFHPEGSPGPQDSQDLFDAFVELVQQRWRARAARPIVLAGEGA